MIKVLGFFFLSLPIILYFNYVISTCGDLFIFLKVIGAVAFIMMSIFLGSYLISKEKK